MSESFDAGRLPLPVDSEVTALLERCAGIEALRFQDEELLIRAGEYCQDVFLLLKGACRVEHANAHGTSTPGSELAIIEARPDAPVFVGEMACLEGGCRTASVRSVMATWALRLKPGHLDDIIAHFPALTRVLCLHFSKRLKEADELLRYFQGQAAMECGHVFLDPGEVLFLAGEPADSLYQLIDGILLQRHGAVTRPIEPGPGGRPEFIEPGPYFSGAPRESTVQAQTKAVALRIGATSRLAAIRNYPELVLSLLAPAGE